MTSSVDAAPDLSGLIELSRVEHLDLKPVILRVQTDLFVRAEIRDRAGRESFEALACGLIPTVDDETALIVAEKLGAFPGTPDSVLAALAARGGAVRDTVVAGAAHLSPRLVASALSDGADIAAVIAARPGLDRTALDDLSRSGRPEIDRALAANLHIALPGGVLARLVGRARSLPEVARLLLARPEISAADLAPLYLHADPIRREAIREAVEATAALRPCPPGPRDIGAVLTGLSAARDVGGFIAALADALGLPRGFLGIAPDAGARYDLLTLGLRAADLRHEEAAYVFLTLDEGVARSAERVFALVRLFRTVSRPAARDLVSAILDRPVLARTGTAEAHQPHHAPEAAKLRNAGAERAGARPALPVRLRKTS
ncbi:DUF2336 domain-containing protein [Methylobacterium trifolii]|uniref:DUF2336 domain-containing protein n=1 Tax=Methylobacterium trifolii TaxID=1003092 RepID=A0ABQ4U1S2_9HYPH|nr:DUF2336 domain-containing protein [Methylobacterium trifolii]GJE60918.1 hypothetical protein MPOCJGCO_3037 [Methylobacterium trifolii]